METLKTAAFDFHLPEALVAQEPLAERDQARLLVLDRASRGWQDRVVRQLPEFLHPGDLLVFNNTRVIPARLRATRDSSGGKIEFLLLPPDPPQPGAPPEAASASTIRRVLTRSGGKLQVGESFTLLYDGGRVTLLERCGEAGDRIEIHRRPAEFDAYIRAHGEVPLPPYIRRPVGPSSDADVKRYQTVYAEVPGAVAAPTAGFHFTSALLEALRTRGVRQAFVTLHVGPGTFRPVKAETVSEHFIDPEPYCIPAATIEALRQTRRNGGRIIAVGTTSLRTLEGAGIDLAATTPASDLCGLTHLFVYPPAQFRVVDALMTNFHIPKSSLLMLVAAFAAPGSMDGIAFMQRAYEHAVAEKYRFYSYGDACLIL